MQLKDITVKQFIGITDIAKTNTFNDPIERDIQILMLLTGKPEEHFLEMSLTDFKKACTGLDGLTITAIDANAKRFIKANGKVYAPVYNFSKLTAGQFVDVVTFLKDKENIIENLPKILASICVPTKLTITGRKLLEYGAEEHRDVCANMEEASIVDAYAISLFFLNVWIAFLKTTGVYMVKKTITETAKTKTKLTKEQTAVLLNILEVASDGITAPKK